MIDFDPSVIDYLQDHRTGVLAANRRSGAPQLTLIAYQFDGKEFAISTRAATLKAKLIARRPDVSLAVVDGMQQLVVTGRARIVSAPDDVLRLHRERISRIALRQESEADLAERLRREERVVILIEPASHFPQTLRPA